MKSDYVKINCSKCDAVLYEGKSMCAKDLIALIDKNQHLCSKIYNKIHEIFVKLKTKE